MRVRWDVSRCPDVDALAALVSALQRIVRILVRSSSVMALYMLIETVQVRGRCEFGIGLPWLVLKERSCKSSCRLGS
jgi:hypothetical protein